MNEYVKKTYEGKQTPKMLTCFQQYCKKNPSFIGNFDDLNIMISTDIQDSKHSIDMTVVNVKTGIAHNIALRSRGEYYLRYADLTIRSLTKSRSRDTELSKIKSGRSYINYYFYCWCADKSDDRILEYMIIDVPKLKEKGIFNYNWKDIQNNDGSCFIAIPRSVIYRQGAMIYDSIKTKTKTIKLSF